MTRAFHLPSSIPGVAGLLLASLVACGKGGGGGSSPAGFTVTITGLPAGLDAAVTVDGPGGYSRILDATATLDGLSDGQYTVTARTVEDVTQPGLGRANGGVLGPAYLQRHPLRPVQAVTVSGGAAAATVRYPEPTLTVPIPRAGSPGQSVPMQLVLVPAGSFTMGSDVAADNAFVSAQPPHQVTIAEALYVARTETTQAQWLAVMGPPNPSLDQADPEKPVEQVSWNMIRGADGFLVRLNAASPPGAGFRLPSEAEWEHAARAGTATEYFFHPDPAPLYGGDPVAFDAFASALDRYAVWGADYRGVTTTSTVASRAPNPWGLFDVIGNVIEWTEDDSHAGYAGAPADGSAWVDLPTRGELRVQRGGSFLNYEDLCRSALRTEQVPDPPSPEGHVGFRLVMPVPAEP
jgi:formylglycine-generating enzyme required for sulfatase activity